MKLGVSQSVFRGSETSPMMGSTPNGVAARRTCPSSVASFRGRATHAPADFRTGRYDGHYYICLGRRPGAPKWFPDGAGGGGGGAGRAEIPGAALRFGRPCDHAATSSSSSYDDVPQIQFNERVVDFPVVRQLRVPTLQTVHMTVEILQVPFLGLVLDMPVVMHRQVHGLRPCDHAATSSSRETVGVPLFSSSTESWLRCETGTLGKTLEIPQVQDRTRCSRTARTGTSTRPSMCQ